MAQDALAEDSVGDLRVNGAQWVVEKVYVSIRVDSPCEADSCLLATGDIDATLSYDRFSSF